MAHYAQLNGNSICIGIAYSTNEINQDNMIFLSDPNDDIVYRKYLNGQWSEEKYPEGYVKTVQDYFDDKQNELLSSCYADIYGKFTIWGKWFACDQTARDDINDLYYASQKDGFAGRYWFTVGGTEVVYITPEKVVPFKDAVVEHKDLCWNKYAVLSNKLGAIDLNAPDAKMLIGNINW